MESENCTVYLLITAHASAITQMEYNPIKNTLFTASKDKKMTLWQFPESWINDEIRQFEQNEIKNINDTTIHFCNRDGSYNAERIDMIELPLRNTVATFKKSMGLLDEYDWEKD